MNTNSRMILGTAYLSLSHFFERAGYYGFRSILLLYVINELMFSQDSGVSIYQDLLLISYLVPLAAGPFLDFVFKAKHGPVIGGGFATVGLCCTLIPNHLSLTIGIVLIGIGSSFTRLGVLMGIGSLFRRRDNARDVAFAVDYLAVNAGALIASVLIAYLSENVSFRAAIALCAVFSFLSAAIPFVFNVIGFQQERNDTFDSQLDPDAQEVQKVDQNDVVPSGEKRMRVPTLIFLFLWGIVFWVTIEGLMLKQYTISDASVFSIYGQTFLTMIALVILTIVLYFINRRKQRVHYIYLGCVTLLMTLFAMGLIKLPTLDAGQLVLGISLIGVLAEILLVPIAASYITRLVNPSFAGTALGIYTASFALISSLGKIVDLDKTYQWLMILFISFILILGGFLIKVLGIRKESF